MDARLFDHIQRKCESFNRTITRGLAVEAMKEVEQYVDRLWRCAEVDFPPQLRYVRGVRCTPQEEYNVLTARRSTSNNRMYYDFSRSDMYLMKYIFEFEGEELKPRYLFLPFVSEGGLITIKDSIFSISPVLADRAISVGENSIYVPVTRAKLTLKRDIHPFLVNGRRISANVIWGKIHNATDTGTGRRTITANSTLPHYLFCKYGVQETFRHMLGVSVHVGDAETINEERFPAGEWSICQSMQMKPPGVRNRFWVPPTVRLAIKTDDLSVGAQGLIGGFFYVADRFPERMRPEWLNDIVHWRTLMGHVIFANDESAGKLLSRIDSHMDSLDSYVDSNARAELAADGVYVNNLYELFMHVIETYAQRVSQSSGQVASMYGKRLSVLRYVLADITYAIFYVVFGLQASQKKKALTKKDVMEVMNKLLKINLIQKINDKHAEVSSVSSPSDCMAFKITSNLVLQSDIGSGQAGGRSSTLDASKIAHASIMEIGQAFNLPKGEPTGRKRSNPMAKLGEGWTTIPDAEEVELLSRVQATIDR